MDTRRTRTIIALWPLLRSIHIRLPLRRIVPLAILAAAVFPAAAPATPGPVAAQRPQTRPLAGLVTLPADDPKVEASPVSVAIPEESEVVPAADEPAGEDALAPCTPKLASSLPQPAVPTQHGIASAIVYANNGNLYLYDVANDRTARITAENEDPAGADNPCWSSNPAFLSSHEILFSGDYGRSIFRLDLSTRKLSSFVVANYLSTFALSPDHKWIAFLTEDSEGTPSVRTVRIDGTDTRLVKNLTDVWGAGRCGSADDEIAVSWSPDGTKLLLVATHFVGKVASAVPTLYVFGLDGGVLATRDGTHARWSPDSATIYFRGFTGVGAWYAMNVETRRDVRLPMTTRTNEIAVSPGGGLVAHAAAEGSEGKVYVYDVMTKEERLIAINHAAPVWLSNAELALTKLGACPDCMDGGYLAAGTSWISASGGHARTLAMASTIDADELYG